MNRKSKMLIWKILVIFVAIATALSLFLPFVKF